MTSGIRGRIRRGRPLAFAGDVLKLAFHGKAQGRVVECCKAVTRHDDDVETGQQAQVAAKNLANDTFDAVSCNREWQAALWHDKPDTGITLIVFPDEEEKLLLRSAQCRLFHDPLEIPRGQQAVMTGERSAAWHVSPENKKATAEGGFRYPVNRSDRGQALAALGTTTVDDSAAVFGGHASTEAVRTGAVQVARLESAFGRHDTGPCVMDSVEFAGLPVVCR